MATVLANSKNAKSENKNEIKKVFSMINTSKMSLFKKILAFILVPFVVFYLAICGLIQMILYPILYVVLTILYDFDLREDVVYSMRKVWSTNYWS